MLVEFRSFMLEQAQDPHGEEKFISFIERNKDNAIIQKSGMYDMAETLKQKRHELGLDTQEQHSEIGNQPVTPSGAPQTGAVVSDDAKDKDKEHRKTAETEVGSRADTGDGHVKPQQFEQKPLPDGHTPPVPTQGTNAPTAKLPER